MSEITRTTVRQHTHWGGAMFETVEEKAAKRQARDEEQAREAAAEAARDQAAADEQARRA